QFGHNTALSETDQAFIAAHYPR
ncbi:MAG: hypothetical protein K0Q89_215, partial [Thermomicrobiales bacterium]|nr:hypothetical protein [Thermomicrobiales bacterium]